MEPLMIPNDLNVDVQSKDFLSHSHEQFQQHIPSISSRKRALHECTTESVRPRKIRRCNTAPPNAPPVQHDAIDDDDDQKYDDEQRQSSLSSSLSSPTVTILSGCGEAAAYRPSNCNENIHRSAPAHLRCDDHHSNVLLSTNKTNNEAQCIDINTGVTESLMDVVPESTLNSAHKEAEKCGFSMTMQTEPTPPTVFVKSEHDENIDRDDNDMKSPPPPDVRNSSADTVDIDQVDNDDDRKHMDEIEPMPVKQGEQHDFEASNDDSFDYEGRVIRLVRLLLDAKRVGGLIGKAGNSITRIRSESQAKILITRAVPHSLFRVCSIEGDCDAIVRGMCLIVDKIAEETTRSPPYQITILVEEKNIGCLIGKGGEAITEIRADTLANIYISSHLLRNSTEKTVDIYGECNQVHEAIKMVVTRLCSNAAFAPTRQSYNPQLDGMSQLQSESQSHSPSTRGWRNSNSNSNQCSSSSRNNNDDHRSAMIPGACVNNNNMSSSLPAVTPLSSALNTHAQNAMLTAASALHNSLGSSCALNQLYPYNYNLNSSALQSRLLQFPPLNYSRLGAMQPQIITSAPTHCNANLSPICSSRYRQHTFSQQQSLLHTNNGTPFAAAAAAFSVPQPQESIPVPTTTTTSVISPLSAQKNDPNSTITSNNPNPYLLSPHLSNFSPQRIETNTFVNSHSHSNSATPLSTADMQTHSNRNSNHSNSNSNMDGERNRNPAVFQQQQAAAAAHCHALDHSLSSNQTAHRNNDNTVHMNKQIPMISTSFRSPLPSGLYYNARVIGTVSPVSSSRSNSGMAAHSPPVNNAMILSSSSGVDSVVLTVASHLIGGVIGKGGRNIQDIRRQSGAEIKIDNERQNPTPNRYITIKGTKQQIANAASLIKNSVSPHMATSSNW